MANEQTDPDAEALIARWGETVARAIASAMGDNFSDAFKNKARWIAKRGMSGGRFRDVNEPYQGDYLDAAAAAIRALMPAIEGEWFPIETAKKDRTVIWAVLRDDIYPVLRPEREDLKRWNGLQLPMRHPGLEKDDLDFGWGVAAPVGHGGFPDEWIAGWRPLPSPPRGTALPDTKGGE